MFPKSKQELLQLSYELSGLTLESLAAKYQQQVPENLLHNKGWVGQLLECALGTDAGNEAAPDFKKLKIELKTIPVTQQGKPKESTYVCSVPLINHTGLNWHDSVVYKKLAQVLWVPIEASPEIPIIKRRIGQAILWQPTDEEENLLRQDWEELMEMVALGKVESITAHLGQVLQIRPKAADSKALCKGIGANGQKIKTLPRGFYLRPKFTANILQRYYTL